MRTLTCIILLIGLAAIQGCKLSSADVTFRADNFVEVQVKRGGTWSTVFSQFHLPASDHYVWQNWQQIQIENLCGGDKIRFRVNNTGSYGGLKAEINYEGIRTVTATGSNIVLVGGTATTVTASVLSTWGQYPDPMASDVKWVWGNAQASGVAVCDFEYTIPCVEEPTGQCLPASTMFKTVYIPEGMFTQATVDYIKAACSTPGYCTRHNIPLTSVSNQITCGGVRDWIGFHIRFTFSVYSGAHYYFRFGVDFGKGGKVFLDGTEVSSSTNDLWWAGNWNQATQLNFDQQLGAGQHTIDIFGGEGCCDGAQSFQFKVGGGSFQAINVQNLEDSCNQSQCPSHCATCNSNGICTQCQSPYTLENGGCYYYGWCKKTNSWLLPDCSGSCIRAQPGQCPEGYDQSYVYTTMHCTDWNHQCIVDANNCVKPQGWCKPKNSWKVDKFEDCSWAIQGQCDTSKYDNDYIYNVMNYGNWYNKCQNPPYDDAPYAYCQYKNNADGSQNWVLSTCNDCHVAQPGSCPANLFRNDVVRTVMNCCTDNGSIKQCDQQYQYGWCRRPGQSRLNTCGDCYWSHKNSCPCGYESAVQPDMPCGADDMCLR